MKYIFLILTTIFIDLLLPSKKYLGTYNFPFCKYPIYFYWFDNCHKYIVWHVIDMQLHKHYDSQCICHTMGWIIYKWIVGKVWAGLLTVVGWALWEPAQIIFFKSFWVYNLLSAVIPPLYMIWLNIWTPQRKSSEIELGKFCYFQSLANITFSFLPMDWKSKKRLKILQFRIKKLHLWYSYTINVVAVCI